MRKNLAIMLFALVCLGTLTSGDAQILTGDLLVLEYEGVLEVQPTSTSTMSLFAQEHITDIVKTEDGVIYLHLVNLTYPLNFSLVKYDNGQFTSLDTHFPQAIGGIEILGESFFLIEESYFEENRTVFLLTELDLTGNRVAQTNITIQIEYLILDRFLVGNDDSLYIMGVDFITEDNHLLKMTIDDIILWDKIVGAGWGNCRDIQVLTSGQVFILKTSSIESRDSDGELLWNTTLSSNVNWMPESVHALDDSSVCIRSSYIVGPILQGATIYRCDIDGNILWNKTLMGRDSTGTDADIIVDTSTVIGDSIQILLHILGAENNPYLLELSKDLNTITNSGPNIEKSSRGFLAHKNGATVIFCENTTANGRYLVAYSFSGIPMTMIVIAGGCVLALVTIVILWKKRSSTMNEVSLG